MSRIRSNILYKRKINELEEAQKQAQRLHIPLPILNNQDNNSEQEENEPVSEDDLNVSDWDDVDDTNKDSDEETADDLDVEEADEAKNDFHWSDICRNWIHLTERENQFDNEEDN